MIDKYDEQLLLGYLEDELTPEQKQQLDRMLVQDLRLRSLLEKLRLDRRQLRQLPDERPPLDLMEQVNQRLERQMLLGAPADETRAVLPARRLRLSRVVTFSSLAALILIGVSLVLFTVADPSLWRSAPSLVSPSLTEAGKKQDDSLAMRQEIAPPSAPSREMDRFAESSPKALETSPPSRYEDRGAVDFIDLPPTPLLADAAKPADGTDRLIDPRAFPAADSRSALALEMPKAEERLAVRPVESGEASGAGRVNVESPAATASVNGALAAADEAAPIIEPVPLLTSEPVADLRVRVLSANAKASVEDLVVWAEHHEVEVVSAYEAADPAAVASGATDGLPASVGEAPASPPAPDRIMLKMPAGKLPTLLAKLNASPNQSAQLMYGGDPLRRFSFAAGGSGGSREAAGRTDSEKFRARNEVVTSSSEEEKAADHLARGPAASPTQPHTLWSTLLNQQIPQSPTIPVFDPSEQLLILVEMQPGDSPAPATPAPLDERRPR